MLLRRITKHVKDQNWFAVGLDFFIVVTGIWVALMVGQWADERQQRSDLARAEADINTEIASTYYVAYERLSIAPCRKARYEALAELLRMSDPQWPGSPGPYGDGELTKYRAFPPALRSSVRSWGSLAWDTALSKGTLDIMDPERRRLVTNYYDNVKYASDLQGDIHKIESRLQVLSYPAEMTTSDRLRYHDVLSEADAQSAALELAAEQIIHVIEDNGLLVLSGDVRDDLHDWVEESRIFLGDVYGACAASIELPLLDAEPDIAETN